MAVYEIYNWYFTNFYAFSKYASWSYQAVLDQAQNAYASISLSNVTGASAFGSIWQYQIEGEPQPTSCDVPSIKVDNVLWFMFGYGATDAQGSVHMLVLAYD
jgi:hypothetical protein